MIDFASYLTRLVEHERAKTLKELDPRTELILHAGRGLNWLGDYLGNPDMTWELRELPVDTIRFTGTSPEWNAILKDQCQSLPSKLRTLIVQQPELGEKLRAETDHVDDTPIAVRAGDDSETWKVIDGMHRFVRAVLNDRETISVWVPTNEDDVLPRCEAHVIYDLIRGMQRHAHDEAGAADLAVALRLLRRTYSNVDELLRTRFDRVHVDDDLAQQAIVAALET
ncbi:hypothetical protein HY374_02170 [Candidatus Berkelbacteria bacterium]|nr:hypothetical protein [Candidatus Berkelbacteria bacterium]